MFARSNTVRLASLTLALLVLSPMSLRAQEANTELKGDLKAIQGEWTTKDDSGESTWVFKGDKLTLKTPTRSYDIAVKVDDAAKPNKTMELNVTDASANAKGFKGPAIYKFDDEKTVTICFGADGNRPTEFKADFQTTFSFQLKKK